MCLEVIYDLNKDLIGIDRYLSREEMLSHEHLPEIRRVIAEFYQERMLGGAIYRPSSNAILQMYIPLVYACKVYRKMMDTIIPVE